MPVRKNSYDLHVWHNATIPLAGRSKRMSARPQRVKTRGVPLRYVEGLNDARTKLADFFSTLLVRHLVVI
jgi:hypothetical protein